MTKFKYHKFNNKRTYFKIASERAVVRVNGEPHKTQGGFLALPVKIINGTFKGFNERTITAGTGFLLLPGAMLEYEEFTKLVRDGAIIGFVCEKVVKNGQPKYYIDEFAGIESLDDVDDFVHDDARGEDDEN